MRKATRQAMRSDRGAVAVEFALLLPLLVALLLGIMEFGLAYSAQIAVTSAAREAARTMVVENSPAAARTAARVATPGLDPALTDADVAFAITPSPSPSPTACLPGRTATTTITYHYPFLTGFFGTELVLTGKAAMRCGG